MYYELYIDVFFMVNFTMDYLLLAMVRKILKCPGSLRRVALGALTGAFLTCLTIALPIPYASVKFILFHGFVNIVMIIAGLRIQNIKELIKGFLLLYISGFLLGGVFQFFSQYVRTGSLFFTLAILSYYVVSGIWTLISHLARQNQYQCQVTLCKGNKKCCVPALIDTGNCLQDKVTGKPVCIADKSIIKELFDENDIPKIRYIPYHSIGKSDGVLPLISLDGIYICREVTTWVENPLVAISEELSASQYKMILNPDILTGGISHDD